MADVRVNDIRNDGGVLVTNKSQLDGSNAAASSETTPSEGMAVTVAYHGKLATTGATFDKSDNFTFVIGSGDVILGLDCAVRTLHVGDVAEVELRHDYAYGEHGLMGKIPACAALQFDLELLSMAAAPPADDTAPAAFPALPAPSDDVDTAGDGATTLRVNGAPVMLEHLGPVVINSDGSTSRISNWETMTERERENAARLIAKRNKKRLEASTTNS